MSKPRNHRLAERLLIDLVRSGEWEIDAAGRVWRLKIRTGRKGGGVTLSTCKRRRAEKRVPQGYLMVRAMRDGVRVAGLAHRLVWQHVHGDIPEGLCINHLNGVKDDNRPENLEPASYSENLKHAHRLGLVDQRGLKNPSGRLSDDDVREIRARRLAGESLNDIAERFSVSFQHVSAIARGKARPKTPELDGERWVQMPEVNR